MKDNAKTKDYLEFLETLFDKEARAGKKSVELSAKEIHAEVSTKPTLPTCCMAMKKVMKQGDEILVQPNTRTGFSNTLKIRYNLEDRKSKTALFPPKKRGRKNTDNELKQNINMKVQEKQKDVLVDALENWLGTMGLTYQLDGCIYRIDGDYGKWMILVDKPKQGKRSIHKLICDTLSLKNDGSIEKCSLCINSNQVYEKEWFKLPEQIRKELNITLIRCSKHGRITEIE